VARKLARMWRELWYTNGMYHPKFTITSQVNNTIAEIEGIRTLVEQSRILPEQEIILRYRATVEAVHSSTTIEGNPLNRKQVEAVLAGKEVAQTEYAVLEVKNYKKALDWLEKWRLEPKPISSQDVLKLHTLTMEGLLPKEKTGQLRPSDVYIVDILGGEERVRYVGPQSDKLMVLLTELFEWLNTQAQELHPVLAASILHYEFVSIHPFSDGNGRVTRLLTMLYLSLRNYSFRNVLVPDIYYLEHRLEYYDALNQAKSYPEQRAANLTPWIEYFVKGFLSVAKKLKTEVLIAEVPGSVVGTIRLSQEELTVLDYIKQMGSISLEEMLDILTIPRRTAQRRLKELVDKGLLTSQGSGKVTIYILSK
jgi:Fic family protein